MAIVENSTFEANQENLVTWFSSTVTRTNTDANTGTWSLQMTTDAAFGSGVQLDNFPFYAVTAGNSYDFSFWYKETTATMPTARMDISWRDSGVNQIGTADTISAPRSTTWTQVSDTFTAPVGTVTVSIEFEWSAAASGPVWLIDDIIIEDTPAGGSPQSVARHRRPGFWLPSISRKASR